MNIYLDIDGVILANDRQAALHADEFVKYIVERYPVYWLTTHCQRPGDDPVPRISPMFKPETIEYLEKIRPAYWDEMKTEAIDFTQPFLWFDDGLFDEEREALVQHNALDSWVEVNLAKDPNQLADLILRV